MKTKMLLIFLCFFIIKANGQNIDSATIQYAKNGSINWVESTKPYTIGDVNSVSFLKAILSNGDTNVDFVLRRTSTENINISHNFFDEVYKGVKVYLGDYIVHTKNGMIEIINGSYQSINLSNVSPTLSESQALSFALNSINATSYLWQNNTFENWVKQTTGNQASTFYPIGKLIIVPAKYTTNNLDALGYLFEVCTQAPKDEISIIIDAHTGSVIQKVSIVCKGNATGGSAHTRYSDYKGITTNSKLGKFWLEVEGTANNNTYKKIITQSLSTGLPEDISNINSNNLWDASWSGFGADRVALDAHWGAEKALEYWKVRQKRDYFDLANFSQSLISQVHGGSFDNATWYPVAKVIEYGDGYLSCNPLVGLDICGHEIGHGINQFTANLDISQPGFTETKAISESLADIWGACLEDYVNKTGGTNKDIWVNGEDFIKTNTPKYFRSLKDPTQGTNPATGSFQASPDCYGSESWNNMVNNLPVDPHIAAGVMNKWFYLLSEGGLGTNAIGNQYVVQGIGIEKAEEIVYKSLSFIPSNLTYIDMRKYTITRAQVLSNSLSSPEVIAVTNAWYAVGVGDPYHLGNTCITGVFIPYNNAYLTKINFSNNTYYLEGNTEISGNSNISNCTIFLAYNATITVKGNLTIKGCHFLTCSGLWNGIEVANGGKLTITNSTTPTINSTLFEDAQIAVHYDANNITPTYTSGTQLININNTIFNRNNVGVQIDNYNESASSVVVYPFSIKNCLFTSRKIVNTNGGWDNVATIKGIAPTTTPNTYSSPYINSANYSDITPSACLNDIATTGYSTKKPFAGIVLNNVGGVNTSGADAGIVIGDVANTNTNIFDNLNRGISGSNSNIKLINNTFQKGAIDGIGVEISNSNNDYTLASDKIIEISTPASATLNNAFFDMINAINIVAGKKTIIKNCDIRSSQNINNISSTNELPGNYGIKIGGINYNNVVVADNNIHNIKNAIVVANAADRLPSNTYLQFGGITIDNNTIEKQLTGATNTGNEYVENAIHLSAFQMIMNNTNSQIVSCTNNHIHNTLNGIKSSYWNQNTTIDGNDIVLGANPMNSASEYYGIKLEGGTGTSFGYNNQGILIGYKTDNLVQNNQVTGSGTGNNTSAIWISQQNNTSLGCNYVNNANHGFKFEGTNLFTKFTDNHIFPTNKYGVTFANDGRIGQQGNNGTPSLADICTSNNSWINASSWNTANLSYMIYCDNISLPINSPFVVRNNSANNTGINPNSKCGSAVGAGASIYNSGTNGGLIVTSYLDGTNCQRCATRPDPYRPANIPQLLEEIAAGTVLLPNDNAEERLVVMQQQLYELVQRVPTLAQSSSDIQQFIYDNQWSSLDFIYYAGYYASKGEFDMVNNLLNYWTPNNTQFDNNYFQYYDWLVNMYNTPNWTPNQADVLVLANKCPITNGTIVYAARNLYNAITNRINNFENSCDVNPAARGTKNNAPEFIRLKQPKIKLNDKQQTVKAVVYPNPATDIINIASNEIKQINIIDITGRVVTTKTFNNINNAKMSIAGVPKGVFLIQILDADNITTTQKLVVE